MVTRMAKQSMAISLSDIQVRLFEPKNGHIGFLSFVLNNSFYVGNIGLHLRPNGTLKLKYPDKVLSNGPSVEIFYPVNECAARLVLKEAEKYLSKLSGVHRE